MKRDAGSEDHGYIRKVTDISEVKIVDSQVQHNEVDRIMRLTR